MSKLNNTEVATSPPAPTDPASGATPTVTHHQQLASQMIATIDATVALMPDYLVFHPEKAKYLRSRQKFFSPGVVTSTAVAAESDSQLQGVEDLDGAAGRDDLQYVEAYSQVLDALKRCAGNVGLSLLSKKWEATLRALQTYQVAKTMVRNPKSKLAPHVTNMGKEIKRRSRKAPAAPTAPTVPTSPSSPTSPTVPKVPQLPQATAPTAT